MKWGASAVARWNRRGSYGVRSPIPRRTRPAPGAECAIGARERVRRSIAVVATDPIAAARDRFSAVVDALRPWAVPGRMDL
jgi:hypothetical protein